MTVEELHEYFESIEGYVNTAEMDQAHFLRFNDDGSGSRPGKFSFCGETCTRHVVKINSDSD